MTIVQRIVPLLAVTGVLLAAPLHAQEWTRFRGPNGTGVSTASIPVECTEATRNWRVRLPGAGHSSPVVWGDRVFVASAEEAEGRQHLLCLHAADGREVWRRTRTFKPYPKHRFNSFASNTPAVDEERVYVAWVTPESFTFHAYDHDGRDLWKQDLGKFDVNHGGAPSPIVVGELVVVRSDSDEDGPESFVTALDRSTGRVRWRTPRASKNGSFSTPFVYQPEGGPAELIVTSNAHGITSLDLETGAVNWEMAGIFQQRCVGSPVLAAGAIFATAGDGGGRRQAFALRPGSRNGGAPQVAYQVTRAVPYVPTPVALGDLLFLWADNGIVSCVRAATGEFVWTERVDGNYFGSPVCAGGKLYAVSAKGELVVVEASEQFRLLGRSDLGEASHSTPAVSGGAMYLRTESHLISLGGRKAATR
jgi:outer membrane protein assembly factor BamB